MHGETVKLIEYKWFRRASNYGSFEHGNETSCFVTTENFFDSWLLAVTHYLDLFHATNLETMVCAADVQCLVLAGAVKMKVQWR